MWQNEIKGWDLKKKKGIWDAVEHIRKGETWTWLNSVWLKRNKKER